MAGKWTTGMVAERLEEAASTLRRLPVAGLKPRECGNTWPTVIHDAMEAYGWNDVELRLGPPTAEAITRMDTALQWLRWLEAEQVRLVWLHAEQVPRKLIMAKFGLSRATAWRLWSAALTVIATRLNTTAGKVVETRC